MQLLYSFTNVLRSSTGYDLSVLEARLIHLLSLTLDQFATLLVGYVNCFASRAENDKTSDTAIEEKEGVLGLCLDV